MALRGCWRARGDTATPPVAILAETRLLNTLWSETGNTRVLETVLILADVAEARLAIACVVVRTVEVNCAI